jgi:prepilin-type N-terminal cleavage/methylation domain-containing protein
MLKQRILGQNASNEVKQRGMTLIELMVAMVVSVIASTAMVMLMANVLGTSTQTIRMTGLTNEMRTAMSLITRDIRRANYHGNAANCHANVNCNPDDTKIMAVTPVGGDCFRYWFDREGDGDLDAGAFQRFTRGSVGVLQMTIADTAIDTCGDDWGVTFDITNADTVNVTEFTVSNAESYNEAISTSDTQDVSKIRITLVAESQNVRQNNPIVKTMEHLIYVRNIVICPGGVCPAP